VRDVMEHLMIQLYPVDTADTVVSSRLLLPQLKSKIFNQTLDKNNWYWYLSTEKGPSLSIVNFERRTGEPKNGCNIECQMLGHHATASPSNPYALRG
jgi:hypothetical protein